jgi:1-phosphatidylinositol-4-phosphate 5-kinase
MTRRNTTGSIPIPNHSPKKKQIGRSSVLNPIPLPPQAGFGEGSLDLASDIHKHSEKIRRERNLKRAKQLQQQQREQLGAEKRVEFGLAAAAASDTEKEPSPTVVGPHISTVPGAAAVVYPGTVVTEAPLLEEKPLVGNLIGEGHVNYVLMYNMLTGIRIAVSRCGGKMMRPIAEEDFRAEHKYSFDMCVSVIFFSWSYPYHA